MGQHFLQIQSLVAIDLGYQLVLELQGLLQPRPQGFGTEQIADPDAGAGRLVHIGGANAPAGGADGGVAFGRLLQPVQQDVVGHNDMGALADAEPVRGDALGGQARQLGQQGFRIHHHAVADNPVHFGPADAGGHQMELKLALFVDYGMAGVVAAGIADDGGHPARQVVNHLALALVAPLSANHGISRHRFPLFAAKPGRPFRPAADTGRHYIKKPPRWERGAAVFSTRAGSS